MLNMVKLLHKKSTQYYCKLDSLIGIYPEMIKIQKNNQIKRAKRKLYRENKR
jgi:hypothetical protein